MDGKLWGRIEALGILGGIEEGIGRTVAGVATVFEGEIELELTVDD
jgi:hypothetical protein